LVIVQINTEELYNELRCSLFRDILKALKQQGIKLTVLHGYAEFPKKIGSDIDCTVCESDLKRIPNALYMVPNAKIIQCIQHESMAFYYIIGRYNNNYPPVFIQFDVSADYRRNGIVLLSSEELNTNKNKFKGLFWIPSIELEFAYYITKKILKGTITNEHMVYLNNLFIKQPNECKQILRRFFSKDNAFMISNAIETKDWFYIINQIKTLRKNIIMSVTITSPGASLFYWIKEFLRYIRRVRFSTGAMICFLGTDGSGKTTVLNQVEKDLAPAFRRTKKFHLFPWSEINNEGNNPVQDPHAKPPWNKVISIAKLIIWWIKYTFGHIINIFPLLVCSTLVLFDRYYQDILVDQKRYRYGGPLWIAGEVAKVIARPDIFLLLDAPPEVLQSRKQEISFEETIRQREKYLGLINHLSNGHIIDASKDIDTVVADAETVILDYMARRTTLRLGISL